MSESGSVPPSGGKDGETKDRHEPRGRKPNDHLPPSRAREVQRAFRLRRAEHLASLEERIMILENENSQLRLLLNIPEADRPKIGSGPTGKGKAIKEGGVPMSERVRARKEARARERLAKGLPEPPTSDDDDDDSLMHEATGSPGPTKPTSKNSHAGPSGSNNNNNNNIGIQPPIPSNPNATLPLFQQPQHDNSASFNYQLPLPFNLPVSPDAGSFADFGDNSIFKTSSPDSSSLFKPQTPGFSQLFSIFDTPDSTTHGSGGPAPPPPLQHHHSHDANTVTRRSPISPPLTNPLPASGTQTPAQPDLLTRLKACCHLSDSHVVNDPGLLIFATRLCQSFPCQFGGIHPDGISVVSDGEHLLLEDSWRSLKMLLDPGGEADGENRINTGRMAAELVIRAAHSRGQGGWITCRYREGMTIRRMLVAGLVQGMGGKFD